MTTYSDLVWKIGSESAVESAEPAVWTNISWACKYVLEKMDDEGYRAESTVEDHELPRVRQLVLKLFQRSLSHKRYELRNYPGPGLEEFCQGLDDTLTIKMGRITSKT